MTGMILQSLLAQIALSEDTTCQFEADVYNADSLATEMAAFANTGGMVITGRAYPTNDRLNMEPAV